MFHDDLMRMEPLHSDYFGVSCTLHPRLNSRYGVTSDPNRAETQFRGIYAQAPSVDDMREGRGEMTGLAIAHEKAELVVTADHAAALPHAVRRDDHISLTSQAGQQLRFLVSAVLPDGTGGLQILMDQIKADTT